VTQVASSEPAASNGPEVPDGVSAFASKVLDQLSLSAWLPATLFVGTAAFLLELDAKDGNPTVALEALTNKPLGIIIVLFVSIVVGTVITQAFELTAIRWLEGYWPSFMSWIGLTGALVRIQSWRRNRAIARRRRRRKKAFRPARDILLDKGVDQQLLTYWSRVIDGGGTSDVPTDVKRAARQLKWERYAPAHLLRSVEAAERSSASYPEPYRIMPTKLGNTLRAGEDRLKNLGEGTLRTFVIRNWGSVSEELRFAHDQYRTRLDMYCVLVFVGMVLAIGGGSLLGIHHGHPVQAGVTCGLGLVFAGVCYRSAIGAATGYTSILAAIDTLLTPTRQAAREPERTEATA
jgi:hypothetical protein